jgi:hypothetical protein
MPFCDLISGIRPLLRRVFYSERRDTGLSSPPPPGPRNKPLQPISVGATAFPAYIAITPNGKTAYVTSDLPGTVTAIKTASNKARPPISAQPNPYAIVIAP